MVTPPASFEDFRDRYFYSMNIVICLGRRRVLDVIKENDAELEHRVLRSIVKFYMWHGALEDVDYMGFYKAYRIVAQQIPDYDKLCTSRPDS